MPRNAPARESLPPVPRPGVRSAAGVRAGGEPKVDASFWERFPPSEPRDEQTWVLVGRISRSVGLKGAVKAIPHSDYPERFDSGTILHIPCGDQYRQLEIVSSRWQEGQGAYTLELAHVTDVDQANALRGKSLYVPFAERIPAPRGAYYPDEIKGMTVVSATGSPEGTVRELDIDTPSPFLVIDSSRFGQVMVPFRKEFIASINRRTGQVTLAVPLEMHVPEQA